MGGGQSVEGAPFYNERWPRRAKTSARTFPARSSAKTRALGQFSPRANLSRALERQNQGDDMAAGMIYGRGPFLKIARGHEMDRHVGRTADPNLKKAGRRAGGRPKRTKSG